MKLIITLLICISTLNSQSQTFTPKADFPGTPMFRGFSFYLDEKVFVGGGRRYPDPPPAISDFWEYNTLTNVWTKKNDIPIARSNTHAAVVNGKAYMGYGFDGSDILKDFYEYNIDTDTWIKKSSSPKARYQPILFPFKEKIYLIAGSDQDGTIIGEDFKDVWEYDPTTDTWTQKNDFPGEGRIGAFAAADDDFVYFGLGYVSTLTNFFSDVWKYYPLTDTWVSLPPLPPASSNVPVVDGGCSFSTVYDNKLILSNINLAGFEQEDFNTFFVFDPVDSAWTTYPMTNLLGNRNDIAFGVNGSKAWISNGWDGSKFFKDNWELDLSKVITSLKEAFPGLDNIKPQITNGHIIIVIPDEVLMQFKGKDFTLELYTIDGKSMGHFSLSKYNSIKISNLDSGICIWSISQNEISIRSGKILIP